MNPITTFANNMEHEVKWYGSQKNCFHAAKLCAGKLTMQYENGNLRYISLGKHEIIRMIYSAVRDKSWLTIPPVLFNEKVNILSDSFIIKYSCQYQQNEIDFVANYVIEGKADNSLTIEMDGIALNSFLKNRIGFCVHHPIESLAGEACTIIHSSNSSENYFFPKFISPHQPFKDISAMKWKPSEDISAELKFSGEVFETEDQRNWTDASYKTYCTPLGFPYPVLIEKGEKVYQKVELNVISTIDDAITTTDIFTVQVLTNESYSFPSIGIGHSTRKGPLHLRESQLIKKIPFDHYRTDIYLFEENWMQEAFDSLQQANSIGYPLELAIFFDDSAANQTIGFIKWAKSNNLKIKLITIFHKTEQSTPDRLIDEALIPLRIAFPNILIGAGTNANFAQLNRSRPKTNLPDYLTFSIHPQEHAFDNASLVENLMAQKYAVESAQQFSGGKGIHVSPVTMQRRFNANIDNFEQPANGSECPSQIDNRLMSLFGASWTLGSIKYLSESGPDSITYYETVGERGVIQGNLQSSWPKNFESVPGMVFPVYHLFSFLLKQKNARVIKSISSAPLATEAFVLLNGNKLSLIVVSFKSYEIKVRINGIEGTVDCLVLDENNYSIGVSDADWLDKEPFIKVSLQDPIILKPYSIVFLTMAQN